MTHRPVLRAATFVAAVTLALPVATTLAAQTSSAAKEPIADNSFFIEEAYNQEPGVVQHISGFTKLTGQRGWAYSFTQEWPYNGQRHQLSYTVNVLQTADPSATGLGDILLNYRLQAVYDEEKGVAFSPRISLSLPTGDDRRAHGMGGTGVQVNLPVSKSLGSALVSHTNAGATYFPKAPGAGDASTRVTGLNLGQSFIWLATPRFNVMLESVWTRTTATSDSGSATEDTAYLVPGLRWGYDFKSGLQVVPGIAVPVGVGPSRGTQQVFLYLSFEHPFRSGK
jgi:hypothetical protein